LLPAVTAPKFCTEKGLWPHRDAAPKGADWLHEVKFDGYRMHARLDRDNLRLLTQAMEIS